MYTLFKVLRSLALLTFQIIGTYYVVLPKKPVTGQINSFVRFLKIPFQANFEKKKNTTHLNNTTEFYCCTSFLITSSCPVVRMVFRQLLYLQRA